MKARKKKVRRSGAPGKPATAPAVGRPRDQRIDIEVVAAVLSTLHRGGYGAVTMEGIARKVNRARTSLYRRWTTKRHLVAYAVVSEMGENPAADTGGLRGDLEAAVETLLKAFGGPLGQALPGLVADMARDDELAETIRSQVLATRRDSMRHAFDRARERGDTRADLDIEMVLDMLTGPFYYRVLFRHAPIDRRSTRTAVEYVLRVAQRR